MTAALWTASVFALIVIIASARLWRQARLRGRGIGTRLALLSLQAGSALLLYLVLFPPAQRAPSPALTVLTADAALPAGDARVILLPESPASLSGPRYPDLATALRAHPGSTHISVRGSGLALRDLDAARDLHLEFEPTALPRGLVELHLPARLRAGARWQLAGQVAGVAGAAIEVLDPASRRAVLGHVDADGHFTLTLTAPIAGRALYAVRILDADAAVVEELSLPLLIEPAQSVRVLLVEGGIGPENKYLKRWALDAGIDLTTQLSLRPGARLLAKTPKLDAASLSGFDLVVLDERAFFALDAGVRTTLLAAVEDGLGVLLRVTGPLAEAQRRQLGQLGFAVTDAEIARAVTLEGGSPTVGLNRRPLEVSSPDGLALLRSSAGDSLALWRAHGTGRVALWWLADSYRLVLGGESGTHGALWSMAVTTLARARAAQRPQLANGHPRVDERQSVCGLASDTQIVGPAGNATPLLRDPDARNCAAWWPERSGWHRLADGSAEWYVRERAEAPGLATHARRLATLELASMAPAPGAAGTLPVPGSPWPWFAAWLVVVSLSWWLERRRQMSF